MYDPDFDTVPSFFVDAVACQMPEWKTNPYFCATPRIHS